MEKRELEFEEAIKKLEEAVQALESGELKLEEALRRYEEGMEYARCCNERLCRAELRVKQLVEQKGRMELVEIKL